MTELRKGIQEKSHDTLIVENRLRNSKEGELIEYGELSKLLGRDVREHCHGSMMTARKALVNESIFFDTIAGKGLKRLTNEEACKAAEHYVTRSRNAAAKGIKHLKHVPFDQLSEDGKKKHLTTSAQLGAVQLFASPKAAKKIEAKTVSVQLAIGDTLKLFGG